MARLPNSGVNGSDGVGFRTSRPRSCGAGQLERNGFRRQLPDQTGWVAGPVSRQSAVPEQPRKSRPASQKRPARARRWRRRRMVRASGAPAGSRAHGPRRQPLGYVPPGPKRLQAPALGPQKRLSPQAAPGPVASSSFGVARMARERCLSANTLSRRWHAPHPSPASLPCHPRGLPLYAAPVLPGPRHSGRVAQR